MPQFDKAEESTQRHYENTNFIGQFKKLSNNGNQVDGLHVEIVYSQ